MIVKVKDYKNRNRYDSDILSSNNSYELFKELLQRVKVLRHYQVSYEYLKQYPKRKVRDDSIRKSLSVVTERLFHEGMSMSKLAKMYSGNISDNTLRTYFSTKMDRKAQSIVFAPIEAKEYSDVFKEVLNGKVSESRVEYIVDEKKKIEEPLNVRMMIKNDVRRKSRNRYKRIKFN